MPTQAEKAAAYNRIGVVEGTPGGRATPKTGTGFLVGPNDVLTNVHVAVGPDGEMLNDMTFTLNDGTEVGVTGVRFFDIPQLYQGQTRIEDAEYDLALLTLDDAVGYDYGWFGLSADRSPGEVHVAGFPGDRGPGRIGAWLSTADYDPNLLAYSSPRNLSTILAGEVDVIEVHGLGSGGSGSPVWTYADSGPYAVGVYTSGAPGGRGFAADLTSATLGRIKSWIAGNGDGADLAPIPLRDTPAILTHGTPLNITFAEQNIGSSAATEHIYGLYLSTNETISTSDTLLSAYAVSALAPGASSSWSTGDVRFSDVGLTEGTYYLGVVADIADQVTEGGNREGGRTVGVPVQVVVRPDLETSGLTLSSATWRDGDEIEIGVEIRNDGAGTDHGSVHGIYLSTDRTITPDDMRIGIAATGRIAPGGTRAAPDVPVTVDAGSIAPGTYWVGAIADYAGVEPETDEANNAASARASAVRIRVEENADLMVGGPAIRPADLTWRQGETVSLSWLIANTGGTEVPSFYSLGVLSTDAELTASDRQVMSGFGFDPLRPGDAVMVSDAYKVPHSLAPGSYWFGFIVDPFDTTRESDETDNTRGPFRVTVVEAASPSANSAPTAVALSATEAPEDLAPGARVATLSGVDPDGDALTYDLVMDETASGGLTLDGDALRIGRALDFETEPALNFRVRATDPGGLSFETDLSLAVRDVDEAPVLSAQGALVSAPASLDLSSRRLAAELTVADDALGSAEISLSGPDAELFEIWRGDLYLIEGADIGAGGGTLEVTVSAVDPALGPSEQGVARVVVAVEPAPPTPIRGENEADRIAGSDGADRIEGLAGDDAIRGQAGDDVVLGGAGADRLRGQAGDDVLKGGKGDDRLLGGDGADRLFGGGGNDLLKGQGGDDVLSGGGGRDRLLGGPGDDVLTGGAKADVFVFRSGWGADAVTDFAASGRGRDLLDLRGVDVIRGWRDLRAAHLTVDGDDIVIDAGSGDVATLLNVAREDLDRTDFLF